MTTEVTIDRDAGARQVLNLTAAVFQHLAWFLDEHRLTGHDLQMEGGPVDMTVGDYLTVVALANRGLTHRFPELIAAPDQPLLLALAQVGKECVAECGEDAEEHR